MKDSGVEWIGEIPEHWKVKKLKFCLKDDGFKSGPFGSKLITANLNDSGRILVYTPEHLVNENVQFSQYVPMEREKELESYLVQVDDILIPIVGTLGPAKLLTAKDPPGILNQRLCKISLDNNVLLLKYGLFLITQTELAKIQIVLNKKGAILDHITRDIILNTFFPIPTYDEQQQIYDFLQKETKKLDDLISKSQSQVNLLQEKRQAIITAAVTGKIDVRNGVAA
jgi:type I restriction enzyme S subunit